MFQRLQHMLIKECIQALRDPRMRLMILVVPVVQLLVFGYAVTTDVRRVVLAVQDLDGSQTSRELVSRLVASGYFDVLELMVTEAQARAALDRGRVLAVLRVYPDFEAQVQAGRTAAVQLLLDGSDANTAGIAISYANRVVRQFSQDLRQARFQRQAGPARFPSPVEVQVRAWFNPNLESRNYYVPGVMATIVTLMSLILTAMAVVREKELGTIEQILVTPITPAEFILGKTLPFALISLLDVLLVTGVGVGWFGIPIRGNLLVLLLGVALFLMTTLGVGLLISTVSHTQQQALMTSFFFFMPAMTLSGFMFPIANMPEPIQWLTLLNPMRYFLVIIRGVFLKGVGLQVLWPQMLALLGLGCFTLALTVWRFRKRLA
jgi:ABC-2 type transport system permease protein